MGMWSEDVQRPKREKLKKIVMALIVVGLIIVLPTTFKDVATILAFAVVLLIIWDKQTEIWAAQQGMYELLKRKGK